YSAKTGAHQIYGAAGFPVKGDGTICTCWFPIHRPELVYSKDQSIGWICGGTPAEGDWVLPSCSAYFPSSSVSIPQDITLAGTKISVDVDIPPPPSEPVPPPYIPQGASLTVTTRDSPMQMETLVQGGVQGTVSHTANVWLEYGASATSVTETVHRSVSAGSFSETFDLPVSAGCGATITYRGVAELVATDIISYGTWKNASTLPCPVAPSTTPFAITVTPSCPDGVTATERITWEDQQAANEADIYLEKRRLGGLLRKSIDPLEFIDERAKKLLHSLPDLDKSIYQQFIAAVFNHLVETGRERFYTLYIAATQARSKCACLSLEERHQESLRLAVRKHLFPY
ncbi:MAG: hypothetical protein UV41_C0060G0009, partial [Candidatus Daviesbacteria bacterium GW2011_GWA2_42_7]